MRPPTASASASSSGPAGRPAMVPFTDTTYAWPPSLWSVASAVTGLGVCEEREGRKGLEGDVGAAAALGQAILHPTLCDERYEDLAEDQDQEDDSDADHQDAAHTIESSRRGGRVAEGTRLLSE